MDHQRPPGNSMNMVIFLVLSGALLFGWTFFVTGPQEQQRIEQERLAEESRRAELEAQGVDTQGLETMDDATFAELQAQVLDANPTLGEQAPRIDVVMVDTRDVAPRAVDDRDQPHVLEGSINLARGRFDTASLMQYREGLDDQSPIVDLLAPANQDGRFYVDFDWVSGGVSLGDSFEGPWVADGERLTNGQPVTLTNQAEGLVVERRFEVVDNYLLRVTDSVTNTQERGLLLAPVTRIARDGATERDRTSFTGPVIANGDRFHERNYNKVRDNVDANGTHETWDGQNGWIGMTDKYWMVAAVPEGSAAAVASMRYARDPELLNQNFFVESRPKEAFAVQPGQTVSVETLLFVGAKEVDTLQRYGDEYGIKFFVRGIDFSFLWWITLPFTQFLIFINGFIGNVGWSIIVFTLIVKAILFFPNDRAYRSMERMKLLSPQVQELNERYKDDAQARSQKMMELYREPGVNPLGGCLPILIQMPVFLALYRVLNVTLETRHAPWVLWYQDMSAKDPLHILNLFGFLDYTPAEGSIISFIAIGPLAIFMGLTMFLQQRMSPPPTDPTQRQIFALMPFIFTFVMANFAAGLVLYWTANNLLTILQQFIIKRSIARDTTLQQSTTKGREKKRFDEQKKKKS